VTWEFEGERDSLLAVELTPDGGRTRLLLDHRRLPRQAAAGYGAGWHLHLDTLEAVLKGTPIPSWEERYPALLPAYRKQAEASAGAAADLEG
jgi:hypothetical protein